MRHILKSPFNRAVLLMLVGNVLFGLWLRPDFQRVRATARAHASPAWAVLLLIVCLALIAYGALEVYLIDSTREPPPPEL